MARATRKAPKAPPDLYTPDEARKPLRLGRNAMYDALKNGDVPSIRLGRKFMVPRVALEALLRGEVQQRQTKAA